jgi:multisubunit Na+/H+ antiporter MnhC subunit
MSLILILAISLTVSAGVWLLLSRDLFRVVVGLAVFR